MSDNASSFVAEALKLTAGFLGSRLGHTPALHPASKPAERKIQDSKYRRIRVGRISLDRELDYRSKLNRSPELLAEFRDYGIMKWRRFVKERTAWMEDTRALRMESQQLSV